MNELVPELIKNPEGQICIYLALGPYNATLPLPDSLAGAPEDDLRWFMEKAVPVMTKGLIERRQKDRHKITKKAKNGTR